MAQYFKNKNIQLKKKDGQDVDDGKLVGLYFSAHWCPPCRGFTPLLKEFYDEITLKEQFEIIFVSFDKSEEELRKYLDESHGNWLHVPFGSAHIQEMANTFKISGIPALILINEEGEMVSTDGRSDVQTKPANTAFLTWQDRLRALQKNT